MAYAFESGIYLWLSGVMIINSIFPILTLPTRAIIHLFFLLVGVLLFYNFFSEGRATFPLNGVALHNQVRLNRVVNAGTKLKRAIRDGEVGKEDAISMKKNLIRAARTYLPDKREEKRIEHRSRLQQLKKMMQPSRRLLY